VRIRRDGERLAFAAPPLVRSGPADAATRAQVARALRLDETELLDVQWVDNGPGWIAARLRDAQAVLAVEPDFAAMGTLEVGIVGAHPAGGECAFEVRAFVPSLSVPEDPVTGSLNASLAQWLVGAGLAPERYVASQGTRLGRAGRVHVERLGADLWIGGHAVTVVRGEASF
ncbi:MAG: PhzF family phenazine biosynthesis protein, partial [Burkholderiaceae bacterium]